MSKFFVAAFAMLLVVTVGCQSDHKDDSMHKGDAMKASSMDACPHCPGKQTASADGTCPVCKMQVAKPTTSSTSGADACPKCPGMQTAKADGTCPGCGAMVARQ